MVRSDKVGDVVINNTNDKGNKKDISDVFIGTLKTPHTKEILTSNPYLDIAITDNDECMKTLIEL